MTEKERGRDRQLNTQIAGNFMSAIWFFSSLLSLLCLTFSYFSNVDSLTRFATLFALL